MNIFKALCNGNGSINEENITSFLGYLLNPSEDHDMKDEFIKRFLEKIHLSDDIKYTDSKDYNISYEMLVTDKNPKYIDIVFETEKHIIAIENKIKKESCQDTQLQEEYLGLQNYCQNNEQLKNKNIILCFLIPSIDKIDVKKYQNSIPDTNFRIITWKDITKILCKILEDEYAAKINPLNDYSKQTIKAFINFMYNFLEDKVVSKSLEFELLGRKYLITEYKSKTIIVERILKKDDGELEYETVSAREIIRRKLDEYKNINEDFSYVKTGLKNQNTRKVGKMLIKLLKSNKV